MATRSDSNSVYYGKWPLRVKLKNLYEEKNVLKITYGLYKVWCVEERGWVLEI